MFKGHGPAQTLVKHSIRALIISYTVLGAPYYDYNGPQNPILIIKAPILQQLFAGWAIGEGDWSLLA